MRFAAAVAFVCCLSGPCLAQDAAGLPQPSILVGLQVTRTFQPLPDSILPRPLDIAHDDVAARESLRREDPDLFRSLVDGGALDPPPEQLALALQTELQRMGCYEAGLDGQFGPRSRDAVARYYAARDLPAPADRGPSAALFRTVIGAGDVTCPPLPVVVQRTPQPPEPTRSDPSPQRPEPASQPGAAESPLKNNLCWGCFK